MNRKSLLVIIACMLAVGCSSTKPGKELLTINGKAITEGDLEFLGTINPRIRAQLNNPTGRKQIIDNITEQELFYQAAVKKGLDHDLLVKEKADLYRRVIVAQSYVEKRLEEDAQKYYDAHKSDFEKLRMGHILIKTRGAVPSMPVPSGPFGKMGKPPAAEGHSETEAQDLVKKAEERLKNKEDFATVAKEVSEDPITKPNGGDLGEVAKTEPRLSRRGYDSLVEKAFSMKVGEVSGPIKTSDGYHIIVVTRGVEVEPFESAKQGIMFKQQGEIRNQLLTDLKSQAKISYADASLKPQEQAAPAGPPAPGAAEVPGQGSGGHDHGPGGHSHGAAAPKPIPPPPSSPPSDPYAK